MVIFYSLIAAALASEIFLVIWIWRILKWEWLKPRKVEKLLRKQGFHGKSYRLLYGDVKERAKMDAIAKAKPCNFTNDIVPRIIPFIHYIVQTFGKKSFTWVGPRPTVLVMDPELVKEVLAKNYVYQKIPSHVFAKNLVRGVATYDTHKWSKHRKLINPAFHLEKLKLMLPAFDLSCSEMLSKWEKIVPMEGWCELDVEPYLQTLTSDAISRTAFGSSFEEGRKIFELQRKLAELVREALQSIYIPGMRFLPTKRNRVIKEIYKETRSTILTIINKRVKAIERGEPSGNDLLGILIESNLKEIQDHGSKFGMSFDDVIEECKLFYFAGQETTSALLTWTLILLANHVDWQDRARAEIMQIFDHNKPDFEGLNHLKIVTMIFNETLRLYPPIPTTGRLVHEDTKLGEILLPAKTELLVPSIMLHHDENLWGADAKEFNPERFSDGVSKATNGQHIFFPFSTGPRVCIGQNFAMIEAKMALAQILQRFCFEISPSYAHSPRIVITLQPQHGAQLSLRRVF